MGQKIGLLSPLQRRRIEMAGYTLYDHKTNYIRHELRIMGILHLPAVHLTKVQKGIYYSGAKVFNSLPHSIKCLSYEIRRFKSTMKKFLLEGSFYTVQEYFDCSSSNNPKLEKFY